MITNLLMVKNMVCQRCILSVIDILKRENIAFHKVLVGEIHLCDNLQNEKRLLLEGDLQEIGLELIDNRVTGLIEKVKQLVIKKARNEVEARD